MKHSDSSSHWLEKAVLVHVGALVLGASWVYGGNIWWMHSALAIVADLGGLLTLAAFLQPGSVGHDTRRKAWWLLPWLLFVGLVVTSSFNPSFFPMHQEGGTVLVNRGAAHPALPSTVNPAVTLGELAFGAGVYLAAFNLLLVVNNRRNLRRLLVFGAVNAVVLAVFGTIQKLSGQGFYFGAATSPNIRFFATFIYYNHWGAFMILWLATAAGLLFHHALNHRARDLWHSPFTAAALGVLFLAVTAPVSASRAATGMAGFVVLLVLVQSVGRIALHRRAAGRSAWLPVLSLLLIAALTLGAVGWLAKRSISERYEDTRIALGKNQSLLDDRMALYRDTWTLAMQKPAFGWGLESYGTAFLLIRPRPLESGRQYEASYVEAHSDWLQSVAETGLVGTALLLMMGLVPLVSLPCASVRKPLVLYPLLGCATILLYAWMEFPFANGAVMITFWTLFFSALRYARLTAATSTTLPA